MSDLYSTYHDHWEQSQSDVDPEIAKLIDEETERQARKLIFIPSESFCIQPVREALSSAFTNIYAEGYPGSWQNDESLEDLADVPRQMARYRRDADGRYYKGTDYVNILERITQERVAEAVANERVPASDLHVNVQPLSGANANNAIYEAFVPRDATVMGMDLSHGGHLTHGSPFNRSGKRWDIVSYRVREDTEKLDYNRIMDKAREHQPDMIIGGFTSYPWSPDWEKFREIADECGALLLADIAHTAGLVIGDAHPSPIGYADVVNFTTHKTSFGPRGAVSITTDPSLARQIRRSVFPGEQGGPHTNKFAAMATAFKLAQTDEYRQVQQDSVKNAKALADALEDEGIRVPYDGTDTHLLLIDVSAAHPDADWELWGQPVVQIMDLAGLVANKNTIPGDKTAADARGVRLGTPWLTQRGLDTDDMQSIAHQIARLVKNMQPVQYTSGRGTDSHAKIELDLLRSVTKDVAELADKAYAEGDAERTEDRYNAPDDYSINAYIEPSAAPDPIERETGYASLARTSGDSDPHASDLAQRSDDQDGSVPETALFHRGQESVLQLRDWRAEDLLQEATSNNVADLAPGEGHRTHLYDREDQLIDEVSLFRVSDNQFLLQTSPDTFRDVLFWLRGLSDGYVQFDPDDPQRKLHGPAVVQNLLSDEDLTAIELIGDEAQELVSERLPSFDLASGTYHSSQDDGAVEHVLVHPSDASEAVTLLADLDRAVNLWTDLSDAGAEPAGRSAFHERQASAGRITVDDGEPLTAPESFEQNGGRAVDLTKPYFVGQQSIESVHTPDGQQPAHDFTASEDDLKTPLLHETHKQLGAEMTNFGGWEMPVQYEGIHEEHRAVRNHAGLFDLGHMGVIGIQGDSAQYVLDLVTTNHVGKLSGGDAQYSFLLGPDGRVLDDLVLYCRDRSDYLMVVNAANTEEVLSWLKGVNENTVRIDDERPHVTCPGTVEIRDLTTPEGNQEGRLNLALQGPESQTVLSELIQDETLQRRIDHLEPFEFLQGRLLDRNVIISRTGYTGEKQGYELLVQPDDAKHLWDELLNHGKQHGLQPAGLGARDTLRIEAGFPLYGHDLAGTHDISPFGAGYGGYVKWDKPYFVGRQALREREQDRSQSIIRFRTIDDGRPIREDDVVLDPKTGECVGRVTSALVKRGEQIGLAYVNNTHTGSDQKLSLLSNRSLDQEVTPGDDLATHLDDCRESTVINRFMKGSDDRVSWNTN